LPRLVGVITDIHGDLQALDAALGRLRDMGCDVILCAGDLIDVEPLGEECVQRLKGEKDLICIRGNHERWALERRHRQKDVRSFFEPCHISEYFGGGAELSRDSLAWLASLPVHWEGEMAGISLAMWHARPGSDMDGIVAEKTGPELRRRLLGWRRRRGSAAFHPRSARLRRDEDRPRRSHGWWPAGVGVGVGNELSYRFTRPPGLSARTCRRS
jgi:hypothetical protein